MTSEVIPEEAEGSLDTQEEDLGPNVFCCSTCQEFMAKAFQLSCKHNFCHDCLLKYRSKSASANMLFCPLATCRKITTIPPDGIEDLPVDGSTCSMSAILLRWKQTMSEKRLQVEQDCEICNIGQKKKKKGAKATHKCTECNQFICGKCLWDHMSEDQTKSHTYSHFHEHDKCCRHDNPTDQYCHECKVGVCYICDVHQHVNHNKEKLVKVFNNKINRAQDLLTRFRDEKNLNQDRAAELDQISEELLKVFEVTAEEVKSQAEAARKQIECWEKEQLALLDERKNALTKKIAKTKQNFLEKASFMESVITSGNDVTNSNHREKIIIVSDLNEVMDSITKTSFSDSSQEVSRESMGIPEVRFNKENIQKTMGNIAFGTSLIDPSTSLVSSWSWSTKAAGTGNQPRLPGQAIFFQNGGLAISGQLNRCIWWFEPGKMQPQSLLHDIYPLGMGVGRAGQLSIINDDLHKTIITCGVPGGMVLQSWDMERTKRPSCICYLSDGSRVLICSNNREGYIYDSTDDDKIVYSFGKGLFFEAHYMCIDSTDRILISDQEEHCIFVFDKHGTFLYDFGSYGEKDDCLKTPKGVCVDCFDNIIIADEGNNRITLFDRDGEWCRHLVDNSEDIQAPFSVTYVAGNPAKLAVGYRHGQELALAVFDVKIDSSKDVQF